MENNPMVLITLLYESMSVIILIARVISAYSQWIVALVQLISTISVY